MKYRGNCLNWEREVKSEGKHPDIIIFKKELAAFIIEVSIA